MNILTQIDPSIKKQNLEYFVQLIRIALADDFISNNEMELLHQIGEKLGFTECERDNIIETTGKSDYLPTYELSKRFEQVYDVVKMALADRIIDFNEMRLASSFIAKSGFKECEIPKLLVLLINGIKQNISELELFEVYKKDRKF